MLWAVGGGAGLVLGAVVAAWLTRRAWPGVFAAVVGAVPFLVLVVFGYNSCDLRTEDQVVGSLIVVVLPGCWWRDLLAWRHRDRGPAVVGGIRRADRHTRLTDG